MRCASHFRYQFVVIFVCLLLLIGCKSGVKDETLNYTVSPSAFPTRTPYLAPQPSTARHIIAVIPTPGSIVNVQDFLKGKHVDETTDWAVVTRPGPSICVELDVWWFLEPGDDFTNEEVLLDRIQFSVDDQIHLHPDEIENLLGLDWLLDDQGNEVAVAGGPFIYCWEIELDAGTHAAHLKVRKTSGQVLEYRWSFTLTDD